MNKQQEGIQTDRAGWGWIPIVVLIIVFFVMVGGIEAANNAIADVTPFWSKTATPRPPTPYPTKPVPTAIPWTSLEFEDQWFEYCHYFNSPEGVDGGRYVCYDTKPQGSPCMMYFDLHIPDDTESGEIFQLDVKRKCD